MIFLLTSRILSIVFLIVTLLPIAMTLVAAKTQTPSRESSQVSLPNDRINAEPRIITVEQIKSSLDEGKGVQLSDATIQQVLDLNDSSEQSLSFKNITFEDDVHISGVYNQITFEHCTFKRNVDFYLVSTMSLTVRNSDFLGVVSLNLAVTGLTLRECNFANAVNLYGVRLKQTNSIVNMTRLSTAEPIRVFWSQFGDKWLRELKVGASGLGDPEEKESNIRQVLAELEFWKDNFIRLGHSRDAAEVNYEIISFSREHNITLERRTADWWLSYLLSWPSRYGTRPYRPIWIGLIVILLFTIVFTITDPFEISDKELPAKGKFPLPLYAFMYSVDTFLPVFDVTGVKNWNWQLKNSYRWMAVIERILGLSILYSAAYSLTYYVL